MDGRRDNPNPWMIHLDVDYEKERTSISPASEFFPKKGQVSQRRSCLTTEIGGIVRQSGRPDKAVTNQN